MSFFYVKTTIFFFFYCSFVVSFEIIKFKSSSFIFVQDFFDWDPLDSILTLEVYFSISVKKKNLRILIGTALNLLITLGSIDILTVLKSANLWKWAVSIYVFFNLFQHCFLVFIVQVFHLLG